MASKIFSLVGKTKPTILSLSLSLSLWCNPLWLTRFKMPTHHHHHHPSFNRAGRWGTTDDFATSFLHFFVFSTALWNLLSSHLFNCVPRLLPPFTCKMVLARPYERETLLYHCSLRLFTIVRSSCGPIACWILARTSSLVTCPLYQMRSILR